MNKIIRTLCSSFTAAGSVFALALALVLPLSTAQASSDFIVYQGVAFNDGTAVASTPITLRFSILASDDTVVYQETQADVTTTDKGFFSHQIGSGTPVVVGGSAATYGDIVWADGYKLKVEVDYANGTAYTDLGTQALSSSVYALRAKTATKLATPRTINGVAFDGSENITAPTNLEQGTRTATAVPITSSTGTSATLNVATTTLAGVMSSADKNKLDGIATNANNYSLPQATAAVRGGIQIFSSTQQSVAANAVTATASRTYGIQLNSSGQAVVNVPWVNTNTTYSAGAGLTLSGTTFSNSAPHVATNLSVTDGTTAGPTINSSTGISATIPTASRTVSGIVTTGAQDFEGVKSFYNNAFLVGGARLGIGSAGATAAPIHVATFANPGLSSGYQYLSSGASSYSGGNPILSIYATQGMAGAFFIAHSDARTKEDIKPVANAISLVKELEPVSYTKIDKVANGSGVHYGFIAQDLETIIPEAVSKGYGEVPVLKLFDDVVFEEGVSYTILVKNAEDETQQEYTIGQERPEGEIFVINKKVDDFRTVDHNMILAQAVAAIKEQQVLIEALQDELKELKKELRATNQSNR